MCGLSHCRWTSRRDFIRDSLGMSVAILGIKPLIRPRPIAPGGVSINQSNVAVAEAAARWIGTGKLVADHGITWWADPAAPDSTGLTLYHDSPGVVLFLLELHNATGKTVYLDEACAGADHIVQRLESETEIPPGLYTGIAGLVFCLEEVYRASGRGEYRAAAQRGLLRLHAGAEEVGAGVAWNTSTDIISGTAGIGLTFLYAAAAISESRHLELAAAAGYRLLELGQSDSGGTKWPMSPDYPRLMPNFSHGTAGVCYFLVSLYQHTGEPAFLDAALAGARYLHAIAKTDGDVCLIFHHEPDGSDLYYLSWCHGPVGTARLFYRLATATGDDEWLDWVARGARGILRSGIPESRTPGFWNNVSQCCGDAGVGEFFVSLHRVTGNSEYLDMAWRVRDSLLTRASEGSDGISWPQAEHRTRPGLIAAQTGFMQGAAGMATFLVHLDELERGKHPAIALPDSPFT